MLKLLKQRSKAPSIDEKLTNEEASSDASTNKNSSSDDSTNKNSSSDDSTNKNSLSIDSTNNKSSSEDEKSTSSEKEQSYLIPKNENDQLKDEEDLLNSSFDSIDQPLVIKEEDEEDCLSSLPDYEEIIRPQTVHVVKNETIIDDCKNSLIADNKLIIEKVEEDPMRVSDMIGNDNKQNFQLNSELLVYKVDSQCNKIGDNINTNAVNEYNDEEMRGVEPTAMIQGSHDIIRLADLTKLVAAATERAAASLAANPSLAVPGPSSCNSIEDLDSEMVSLEGTDDEQSSNCFQSGSSVSSHLMMMAMNGRESGSSADRKRRKPVPLNTMCPICGNAAPGHSHFGGMCCYSCRAFFRRTSTRPLASFKCRGGENNCEVTAGSKCCIRCRLRKCLQSGMDPSLIKGRRVGRRSSQYHDDSPNQHLTMDSRDHSMHQQEATVAAISPFKENSRPTNTSVIRSIGSSIIHKTLSSAVHGGGKNRLNLSGRLLEERLNQPPMVPAPVFDLPASMAVKQHHPTPRGIAISILNHPSGPQEYSNNEYLQHIANNYNTGNLPHSSKYHYLESRSPPLRPPMLESPVFNSSSFLQSSTKECYSNMSAHMPRLMPIHPPTPPSEPRSSNSPPFLPSTKIMGPMHTAPRRYSATPPPSLPPTEDSYADDMDCSGGDDKPLDLSSSASSLLPPRQIISDRPAVYSKLDGIHGVGGNLINRQDYKNFMEIRKREQYYRDKLANDYLSYYGHKDYQSYSDRRDLQGHHGHGHQGQHELRPYHNQTPTESHTQKMGLPRLFFKAK